MPVPMLRFKEFRTNSNFKTVCLEHAGVEVIDGDRGINYPSGSDFSDNGFCLFLNAKNVTKNGFSFDEKMFISQDKDNSMSKGKLVEEDLVLTTRGSIGNLAYFNDSVPFQHLRINSGMVLLRAKNSELLPQYLYQQLNSPPRNKNVELLAFGSAQPQLTVSGIKSLKLNIPSVEEQTKIANFLTAVDAKISQLTKKHELLTLYKKGVMQKIFNQKLRFKDDEGREFPEWKSMSLAELGDTYNGLTGKTANDFGIGANYITYKQIFDSTKIDTSKFGLVSIEPAECQNVAKYGDLFFTTSSETPNEVGYCSVLLEDVERLYLNSFCFGYRIKSLEIFSPEYAQFMFFSSDVRESIILLAQGSTRYNISKTNFMKIQVPIPVYKEQTKIANFLTAIDDKIKNVKSQLEATKEYKQGLLQQMFV